MGSTRRATRTPAGRRAEEARKLSKEAEPESFGITCLMCGESSTQITRDFFLSSSPVYAYTRSLPICKNCARKLLDQCVYEYGDPLRGMDRFCEIMDVYYDPEIAEKTKGMHWLNSYMTAVSRAPYIGKTYADTLLEKKATMNIIEPEEAQEDEVSTANVSKKLIRRWGIGYEPNQYAWMQDEYDDWCKRYEILGDKSLEILITNIVRTELEIQEASSTGADVNKLTTRLNTLLGSANLKPSQNAENAEEALYPFGVEIEKVEEEMPIEPDPDFEDVDGVLKYIQIFSGHIAKIFNRPNRYSQIYEEEMEKYTVHPPYYDDEEEVGEEDLFNEGE